MSCWTRRDAAESPYSYLVCAPLLESGLRHAFSLRPSAPTPQGSRSGPPQEILRAIGLPGISPARPRQIHGRVVARPGSAPGLTEPREADAVLVAAGEPAAAAVASADCVGAVLHDPAGGAFAVIHAGWRGTLAGVVAEAVRALESATGNRAAGFQLAMGPSIGGCCYEVGRDLFEQFERRLGARGREEWAGERGDRPTVDLPAVNRLLALEAGLEDARIHACGICTACRTDICWSFRMQGPEAGRMWTMAGRSD